MRALQIAGTGMVAQQYNVEVTANNLANMNTTGYKRMRAEFQDLLYEQQTRVGSATSDQGTIAPVGVQLGVGVRLAGVAPTMTAGTLKQTDNALDMAIQGDGYFSVELPSGETGYTRDGSFQIGADGSIVTVDGLPVQPGIVIPEDVKSVTVNASGEVFAYRDNQPEPENLGRLTLTRFVNPAGLERRGDNLLTETQASGAPQEGNPGDTGFGTVRSQFLESSNVDPVREITNLIEAQRGYEMSSKTIQTADQMMQTVSQLR
jgi:flagellar basal-body rod protein FlgG